MPTPDNYESGLQALAQGDWPKAQRQLSDVDPKSDQAVSEVGRALDRQWVEVKAGAWLMGREDGTSDERPAHEVRLDAFSISRFEVTNVQYQRFINKTGNKPPRQWVGGAFPKGQALWPVTGVSWQDAVEYCRWLGQDLGANIRLPTEAEWEYAARGAEGNLYPWGAEDKKTCRNAGDQKKGAPVAVGSYPCGATPSGIMDLAGNVREWTRDVYGPYKDPHSPPAEGNRKVIRGGSWNTFTVISTGREYADVSYSANDLGFRLVQAK